MSAKLWFSLCACLTLLNGCQVLAPKNTDEIIACPDERAQVCSMQYQPVCAFDDAGKKVATFGNACGACAQAQVMGYLEGACQH